MLRPAMAAALAAVILLALPPRALGAQVSTLRVMLSPAVIAPRVWCAAMSRRAEGGLSCRR